MKRPNVSAMKNIEDALQNIEDMKKEIASLGDTISNEHVAEMSLQLEDCEQRLAAARYLYWEALGVTVAGIAQGLLGVPVGSLLKLIGTYTTDVKCERCKVNIEARSRTHLDEIIKGKAVRYAEGWKIVCDNCRVEIFAERKSETPSYADYLQAKARRYHNLATMPYCDYLQTPEWQATRKRKLKQANYKCQVCNTNGKTLDVHHRTYERRGNERDADLIVLCRDCHSTFHEKTNGS